MLRQRRNLIRNLLFLFLGVAFFVGYTDFSHNKTKSWSRLPQGKQNRSFEIDLSSVYSLDEHEITTIIARIQVYTIVGSKLSFSWALPEGVEVVNGELTNDFLGVQAGQTLSTEIVVKNFESKTVPKTISIQVFEELNGIKYGGTNAISNKLKAKDGDLIQKTSLPSNIKIHQ